MPNVDLIYDADCPNVRQARARLLQAFTEAGQTARWREWCTDDPATPERFRQYGSPTILVDGRDIEPIRNEAGCCRLYSRPGGGYGTAPSVQMMIDALQAAVRNGFDWRNAGLWIVPVGIAFLPKLICPACWPAYAALVGALGMPFLLETVYLLPITIIALSLVAGLLAWRAPARHGYGPLLLGLTAGVIIVISKFVYLYNPAAYGGAVLLLAACIWNSLPVRSAGHACPACGPSPNHSVSGGNHDQTTPKG